MITFSGCPGDCETSKYPNWAVATWPEDYEKIRRWQWEEKLIPYWKKAGAFAKAHHVRVALEIHPGFCVYNVPTVLRLREAVGDAVGANLDPSHLFWQGVDPVAAVHALRGCIYHFHAKDTYIDPYNTAVNGVLPHRASPIRRHAPGCSARSVTGTGHRHGVPFSALFSRPGMTA